MKTVHPKAAYECGKNIKVQRIYKRDQYKPWTFNNPEYVVAAELDSPKYALYGWYYVGLGTIDEPTTYDTEEEAKQFMEWIKNGCKEEDKVEDVF